MRARKHHVKTATVVVLCTLSFFCNSNGRGNSAPEQSLVPVTVRPTILATLPHDTAAFTQGFFYHKGKLYESTGLFGSSSLRTLDTNGSLLTNTPIADVFAEGCAVLGNNLYQITWQAGVCFVYDSEKLTRKSILTYRGEGWGLTADGTNLIMSNGSDTITYRDASFAVIRKLAVTNNGIPLQNINELEYARGKIYANVWYSDFLFVINPESGVVGQIIDCEELVKLEGILSDQNVLNGIAWLPETDRFLLTGKKWKHLFMTTIPVVAP